MGVDVVNTLGNLGRVVAYYPNLKPITGSTSATLFLCQLIYWTPRARKTNGWIKKTADEIEEETGLTYNEQKTAREHLAERNLIYEERKPLEHTIQFKVNQKVLNREWENLFGKPEETEETTEIVETVAETAKVPTPVSSTNETIPATQSRRSDVQKKGDMLDGMFAYQALPANKAVKDKEAIQDMILKILHVRALGDKWDKFIDYAYTRQKRYNEPAEKFLRWILANGYNPIYMPPEKMMTLYPQAFMENEPVELAPDFVKPLPEVDEPEYVPMPTELRRKKEI